MAFPDSPLPIRQEIYVDGGWEDVTEYTRNSDNISITRGANGDQTSISSSSCNFVLNNRDGRFSGRNPLSPYYGLIGRNTEYRVSTTGSEVFVKTDGIYTDVNYAASTTDKAVLDITGDIDLRADVEPDNWRGTDGFILGTKYDDDMSWTFGVDANGYPFLLWSTDGTTSGSPFHSISATAVAASNGRQALRVALDVNNGAAGHTATFYTSDTISGSWTQLGNTVTVAGTTSIFSSSSDVYVGGSFFFVGVAPTEIGLFVGKFYRFQIRNSAGTLVADMNPNSQTEGTFVWSDGLATANTWETAGELTAQDYRFWGQIDGFPQRWDTSGTDIYVPVRASDAWAMMTQGERPLRSALYREFTRLYPGFTEPSDLPDGYWPMEDGPDSSVASAVYGKNATFANATFTTDNGLPASAGCMQFTSDDGQATGFAKTSANATEVQFIFFFKLAAIPGGARNVMHVYLSGGSVVDVAIGVNATQFTISIADIDGVVLDSAAGGYTGVDVTQWTAVEMYLENVGGGSVEWRLNWRNIEPGDGVVGFSDTFTATIGRINKWHCNTFVGKSGMLLAHVAVGNDSNIVDVFSDGAHQAWQNEPAYQRFFRLWEEEYYSGRTDMLVYFVGSAEQDDLSNPMGIQSPATLSSLYQECADALGGQLYCPRDKYGLTLRSLHNMERRAPIELDYSAGALSGALEPEEDLLNVRNDVTVSQREGAFARSIKTDGPLGTDTIGVYDLAVTRSVYTPAQLEEHAEYETYVGTWDDLRYRRVQVQLERHVFVNNATLTANVRGLDIGRNIALTNMPSWVPPGPVELLIRGYTEVLMNRGQVITWNTVPYGPYGAVNDLTSGSDTAYRLAASNTTLAAGISDTATSMTAYTGNGRLWRLSSGAPTGTYPLDVMLGGEEVAVGALANVTLSYVAVGTVSHANNASVTPSLPAGLATGDVMFLLAAIRNTAATSSTPTDWTLLTSSENVAVYAKIAEPGEAAPTVSFSGGSAGDDTTGQIAAFRPSSAFSATTDVVDMLTYAKWSTNTSAQDIAYPGVLSGKVDFNNSVILYIGWKQDDWTSVASPGTEIAEPDTTTGNDQGVVWAYTIQTSKADVSSGSFTVTGGASAVSKGAVLLLHSRHQVMSSLTRSTNGIVKAQTAGEEIQVADPFYAVRR